MGIPKFYRWLSERYPLINQPGGATIVPIIDNFYLDMNGIIHNCTHGNNPDVKLTEDEMILRIFSYLDKLFHIVQPQKILFMAIDGVAPRAKMNQQRSRRFKSAKEAEAAAEEARRRGEVVPDADSRFDSNCITPGTPFMARLGAHLRFFVRKKISSDPAWQKPAIVFSGHDVPGEGEHKIMEYIRWAKKMPTYSPNTRHCLYGLDADLVMLSLVTHEPHFCLLREVVSYSGGSRGQPAREVLENPCQEHFVLLQIGLLRDYFDLEFKPLASSLPFPYDLERILDDFVLFCMLVGNDFLPPLPTCDISEGSLDGMMEAYRRILPTMGGYITYAGDLHRGRFELFLKEIAEHEADVLEARAQDAEEYESRQASKKKGRRQPEWDTVQSTSTADVSPAPAAVDADDDAAFGVELAMLSLQAQGHELELLAALEGELDPFTMVGKRGQGKEAEEDIVDADAALAAAAATGPTMMSVEARSLFLDGDKQRGLSAWRSRYYREKLKVQEEQHRMVVESYIQGLHWVLEYYYRGVASWNWFYPYHYAPMASDCTDLKNINVTFSLGKPFLPYEQLLSVQPGSSCRLLPEPYRWLMTDPTSPIADFYPVEFQVDLEGKRADWEGIVLIPFIDEKRLLAAAASVPPAILTKEERSRNQLGEILVFSYAEGSEEESFCVSTLPSHYTSVTKSNSTVVTQAAPPPIPAGEKGFLPVFVPGTKVGATGPPGFPTLRTLALTGALTRAGVNVFGMASKKDSLILTVTNNTKNGEHAAKLAIEHVASAIVGQRAWVKWPYLQEALVEAVSDGKVRIGTDKTAKPSLPHEVEAWHKDSAAIVNKYKFKQGFEIGGVEFLVHVRPCEGLIRQLDGTVEKRFSKTEAVYPLQVTLRRNPSPDPRFQTRTMSGIGASSSDVNIFPRLKEGTKALFLGRAHYGCIAEVLPSGAVGLSKKGRSLETTAAAAATAETTPSASPSSSNPYRILVTQAAPAQAQAANAAQRILKNITVNYQPSGAVARRLGVTPRVLGRITSNVWLQYGDGRGERIDIGLCVKNAGKSLYVPDYCVPLEMLPKYASKNQNTGYNTTNNSNNNTSNASGQCGQQQPQQQQRPGVGWAYSDAMVRVLEQYKQRFGFVWAALDRDTSGANLGLSLEDLFPRMDTDTAMSHVTSLQKWLKSMPLSRRPLVSFASRAAPENAVRMLQSALPPSLSLFTSSSSSNDASASSYVELENVAPALLLPPLDRGELSAAFAGGSFEIGDRVAAAGSSGLPEFGARGTVVGVYNNESTAAEDGARDTNNGGGGTSSNSSSAIEVLFDKEFIGGTDLFGRCNGKCGALLPASQLLNLSKPHAVRVEGGSADGGAPRVVKRSGGAASHPGNYKNAMEGGSGGGGGAAAALAAASAALQSGNNPPKPASSMTTPAKQQPKIPDKSGAKGFAMGRGQPIQNIPPPPVAAAAAAPSMPGVNGTQGDKTKAPGSGAQLLAHLQQAQQQQMAPGSMPPPPLHHHQHMMPPPGSMPPPPLPPHMMMMMPPPLPHPGYHPMMMPPPGSMPPPPLPPHMMIMGAAQGNALLAQLQQQPQQQPQAAAGAQLLTQLQQSAQTKKEGQEKKKELTPPTSPSASGALLLQKLQQQPAHRGDEQKKGRQDKEPQQEQEEKEEEVSSMAPPMPPPSAAALLTGDIHGSGSGSGSDATKNADALWKLLSNAGHKK